MTSQCSFDVPDLPVPVSFLFDASVLPHLAEEDRKRLQNRISFPEANFALSEFSLDFRRCLYAICGADSANLLQVDPASCTRKCLNLDHLEERPIKFFLRHISDMPKWTRGKLNKGSTGDHVVVERVLSPPYLQGDHRATVPKGALDLAISAMLRDCVWINLAMLAWVLCPTSTVGISYTWQRPGLIGSVWMLRFCSIWEMTNAHINNQAQNTSQPRPPHFLR